MTCCAATPTNAPGMRTANPSATSRLYSWYLHTADGAVRLLYQEKVRLSLPDAPRGLAVAGFEDRVGALAWLDAERANLVAAVQQAAEHGPRPPAWLLADTLAGYFWHHRHMRDWIAVAYAGVDAAAAAGDPAAQAAAHHNLGMARWCLGDYARAADHFTSALALARQVGWVDGEAASLGDLAFVCSELGQLKQAADHLSCALALHRRTGHKAGQAMALGNLGHVYLQMGRPSRLPISWLRPWSCTESSDRGTAKPSPSTISARSAATTGGSMTPKPISPRPLPCTGRSATATTKPTT
jgi:tetratricopeptide (TPR) repeat protein